MDVCRGIAASLNINTNAVMPIQVSNYDDRWLILSI